MELGLILTLLGIGGSFWVVAFILIMIGSNKKRKCTVKGEAVVVDYKLVIKENTYYYHPVYEYFVEGIRYKKTGSALSNHTPGRNTTISIMYNPHNPQESYIQSYDAKTWKILAVLFAAIGCIPVVVCIGIALFVKSPA